ncbi:MAG: hypothetical protein IPK18_00420 [Sphingobacteriales bacterium]|nr:MAG: hypothetical protein IPK18_00420 [Sphingobacteriales bacterium]
MKVIEVTNTPGTDCDDVVGICNGSEWEWLWRGGVPNACHEIDNSSANTVNPDKTIWGTNSYWSADCWPTGNISVTFYGQEDDGVSNCDIESGAPSSTNSYAYPSATAGAGNITLANPVSVTAASGAFGCACGGNVSPVFTYKSRWEVVGAYAGNNLDANGYTNNKTCATAKNITSGNRTDDVNQCTDAWYYFDVSATNLSNLTFNGANGTVTVFYDASSSCNTSCEVGSGNGSVSIGGPISVGRYYIRVSANGGRTNISRSTTTGANTNNYIAAADDAGNNGNLGAMPAGGGTLAANDNNNGTNQESGEPGLADSHTDWFFFTTGATVPAYVDINVYGDYGGDDLDADFKLWKQNDTAYVFPRSCVDWSKLTNLGDGDGDDNVNCRIDGTFENTLNSYRRFCLDPNSKYYVQVAGWQNNTAVFCPNANEDEGTYRITVVGSTTAQGKDNVCDAHDFGTLNSNSSTGNVYYNNTCLGTQAGEQRLGDMSNTMWYKFTTPTDGLTGVNINIEEAGEDANYVAATLYLKSTAACSGTSGLTEVAFDRWCFSDGGTFSAECLLGGRDYYLQVGTGYNFDACTNILNGGRSAGRIKVNISSYNATNGVDNICNGTSINAKLLGNINTTSGSFATLNNQSNICASTEAGEPSGGQKTVWYYFTTGATVPRNINIRMAEQDGIDPDLYLYEACGNVCGGPTWSNLTNEKNSWDADATNVFDTDAEINETGYLHPNSTYFIRCDGGGGILETEGIFSLAVNWNGTFNSNDDFCNAWLAGTTNGGAAAHTESITNNDTLDLGETISIPTFNNKSATAQEQCALDEPNVDNDDETVWIKFVTSSTPGSKIRINASGSNGSGGALCTWTGAWLKVYEADGTPALPTNCTGWTSSTNWFNGITLANGDYPNGIDVPLIGNVGDESVYDIECPKPNTTYWVQLDDAWYSTCDMMDFTMTITDNGFTAGPDKICDATNLGTLSNTTNTDLFINKQTNICATVAASGEPDAFPAQSIDKTVWYKFTTPAAYYPTSHPLAQLPHVYTFEVDRLGGSIDAWPTFAVYEQTATTVRTCTPENAASFSNLSLVDYTQNLDFGDAKLEYLCLKANTTYYVQVDHASVTGLGGDYVDFSLRVKKAAFRAADNLCDAVDLGIITQNGTAAGTSTNVNWTLSNKFTAAPYFGLPHTNKCTAAESGENDISNPGSNNQQEDNITGGGTHTATTWYKFTTGTTVPDWIYWYNNDNILTDANRGTLCLEPLPYNGGVGFNSEVTFLLPETPASCPIQTQMAVQPEMNIPGDLCEATTGYGFGAPCYKDLFRLKCPIPNTTYYVQIKDAGAISLCYEGLWSFDNGTYGIKTAPTLGGAPINDSICNAIDLGSVPNGGQLAPATLYDNFCATPDVQWRADFSQELEADVWFRFKPPLSGSVLITAQSAPAGSPGVDDDLDIQMAIWEPILGNGTNTHCSDPRYLWTPILAQDHKDCELTEAGIGACSGLSTNVLFAYDIYNTCGGSSAFGGAFCNEGNSFIATCLDPNKYYYLQVDGGDYLTCDLLDAGDCVMGYFKLQIKDAALGLVNPDNTATNISPYTGLGIRNFDYIHDEPCFAYNLGSLKMQA